MRLASSRLFLIGLITTVSASAPLRADYNVTNLVSNVAGLAQNLDANLKNPWGVSFNPIGPFWVSNQGSNNATLYDGTGAPLPLVVSTPTVGVGPNGPTGQVFNGDSSAFHLSNGNSALFLFANLNGQISGWNPGLGTSAEAIISGTGAIYTGLGIGQFGGGSILYAADALGNKIDVYDSTFGNLGNSSFAGKFVDSTLAAAGFRVFNVQRIGSSVYVTYNSRSNGGDPATSGGAVAVFDLAGNLLHEFSNGRGGPLEDPWGVALAPTNFGEFGGALLVGSKESGKINAFDATDGTFLGTVATIRGNDPGSTNNGLWGLTFGNGGRGGDKDTLYAFAGINDERDGLIAAIRPVPEPASLALLGIGGILVAFVHRKRSASV
ncbi:TIGR03118 family protein [Tundrisphaera lichenicola]|uniref:TIGR03118 family protein n=1 Tax=Tundrisphaera lichenicola TaxID=2029860 RepID=UPI003EBD78EA